MGSKSRELKGVCGSPSENWEETGIVMKIVCSIHLPRESQVRKTVLLGEGRSDLLLLLKVEMGQGLSRYRSGRGGNR